MTLCSTAFHQWHFINGISSMTFYQRQYSPMTFYQQYSPMTFFLRYFINDNSSITFHQTLHQCHFLNGISPMTPHQLHFANGISSMAFLQRHFFNGNCLAMNNDESIPETF
jgi:hypothetical protein